MYDQCSLHLPPTGALSYFAYIYLSNTRYEIYLKICSKYTDFRNTKTHESRRRVIALHALEHAAGSFFLTRISPRLATNSPGVSHAPASDILVYWKIRHARGTTHASWLRSRQWTPFQIEYFLQNKEPPSRQHTHKKYIQIKNHFLFWIRFHSIFIIDYIISRIGTPHCPLINFDPGASSVSSWRDID